jgi:hypothetical protein
MVLPEHVVKDVDISVIKMTLKDRDSKGRGA